MATQATRSRALSLYRKLIRSSRTWPGPAEEKRYILDECRSLFRQNQHLSEKDAIEKSIIEGETRYDYAWHYKIPYPRLHNFATGTLVEKPSRITGPVYEVPEGVSWHGA
ncbi:hypothetical protein GOP47_0005560 [Adiantum capillus-veneris]|uniref:Complex 1 LYR protein domain-containing protein n=1 Tax=Adiantum capillus-veneris TaxID=13818 RepID=A0A9D4ZNN4_ADICA|nr:hypothetical protein GOP47_0005560 [Adiantum capillus-veneris]